MVTTMIYTLLDSPGLREHPKNLSGVNLMPLAGDNWIWRVFSKPPQKSAKIRNFTLFFCEIGYKNPKTSSKVMIMFPKGN